MPSQGERFKVVAEEKRSTTRFLARMVEGAQPAPIAGFVQPCLPAPAKAPPRGADWVHEIRFEGLRIEAQSEPNRLALYDAAGNAMTKRLARIADAVRRLPVNRIVLDGIVIVQDATGGATRPRSRRTSPPAGRTGSSTTSSTSSISTASTSPPRRSSSASGCSRRCSTRRAWDRSPTASTSRSTAARCSRASRRWASPASSRSGPTRPMYRARRRTGARRA